MAKATKRVRYVSVPFYDPRVEQLAEHYVSGQWPELTWSQPLSYKNRVDELAKQIQATLEEFFSEWPGKEKL